MKRLLFFAALSASAALSACSSGDDDGGRNVVGIWSGAATKTLDTCTGSTAPQTPNFTHNVTQNDTAVVLVDENGIQFVGNTLSDDGFSVDASTSPTTTCSDSRRIEYQSINSDEDPTASVEYTINRVCTGQADCKIAYSGTAARNSVVPTPAPTGTPVAGTGCLAINPNPAADTYSGDGGCGISNVVYRASEQSGQNVVILEPFGINGASSFTVNPANTAAASSNNTDLTIQGVAGYSCALACSPPTTFSVACFKEGAATCTEKF